MKLSNLLFRLYPLLTVVLLIAGVWACGRVEKRPAAQDYVAEINDSLHAGNIKDAIRLTESLKRSGLERKDSGLWAEGMVMQAIIAYYRSQPELLLASSDSALEWIERQPITPGLARLKARAYETRGAYYDQYQYNPDSTARYLRLAVDNVELSGVVTDLPQAYANYANAMRVSATLDSAALYYHRAITVADSLGLAPVNYIPLYNGIASVLTDMRDFNNSALWWNRSMGILDEMNQFDKFNTLTGYGNDLYYREDYAGSNRVFERLKRMLDSIPDSRWERMFTDVNIADTYLRLGRAREAVDMLDSTSRFFSVEQPNPMVRSYIHTLQMRAALKTGDRSWASYLAKEYPPADTMRFEQLLARLKVLEELYDAQGDYRRAYDMKSRYDRLNDSLRSYNLKQQISTLNATYERDTRILNLVADNTRQQAHIYRLLAWMAIAVAVIVALGLWTVMRRGRMVRREQRMQEKIVSLREENLRNRVTPHFIYNALNHELNNAGDGKPSHLDALVNLIRRQQYITSEVLIPFAEELAFVDDYIRIIGDNGRDPLDYSCTVAPDIDVNFLFPSMALQILVENAFKHGFTTLRQGELRVLHIIVEPQGDSRVAVKVFNNAGSEKAQVEKGGTGLRVLVETIRLINERNKEKTVLTIDPSVSMDGKSGYIAIITIPLSLKK